MLKKHAELARRLGLTEQQLDGVVEFIQHEARFRRLLIEEGVNPRALDAITKLTDTAALDWEHEDLIRAQIHVEWC